jgi:hypothetical protein
MDIHLGLSSLRKENWIHLLFYLRIPERKREIRLGATLKKCVYQ